MGMAAADAADDRRPLENPPMPRTGSTGKPWHVGRPAASNALHPGIPGRPCAPGEDRTMGHVIEKAHEVRDQALQVSDRAWETHHIGCA
jgi:hypothetical protein